MEGISHICEVVLAGYALPECGFYFKRIASFNRCNSMEKQTKHDGHLLEFTKQHHYCILTHNEDTSTSSKHVFTIICGD